jgi:TetR/AcrR family transcriptional regulator, cholesterol catabolism regulator
VASDRLSEILEAALALFSEKGYEATSMRDLAEAVGIQPASLYAHIRGKEDLLMAIIEQAAADFGAGAQAALADPTEPVAVRLRRFLRTHIQLITENLQAATVYLHEWKGLDRERQLKVLAQRDRYERQLVELLEEGVRSGELRPLDVHLTSTAVFSMANWVYTWYSPEGTLAAEEIADRFFDLVVGGIGAPGVDTAAEALLDEV